MTTAGSARQATATVVQQRRDPALCVGIATRGRPAMLGAMLRHLQQQSVQPGSLLVCGSSEADLGSAAVEYGVTPLVGPAGLPRQRNLILDHLPPEAEIVVFFDDDFFPKADWLKVVVDAFRASPDVACITGNVIADGIKGEGLTVSDAVSALSRADHGPDWVREDFSPYGCNMAFRRSAIGDQRFDPRLVLYGWLEDRDFGARLQGRSLKLGRAVGVHLGVKSGRVAGRRLGYSQVMNPFYLRRKGTMAANEAIRQIARNLAANLFGSIRPEPFIDRRGRMRGNLMALADLATGRCTPERAERL